MNISKNILSLGLIAVISGISTAQTYTATAGTNGVTDIQSDYSMSTGDGASVSVDVPLEFELPKKVAIAIEPEGGTIINPLFGGSNPLLGTKLNNQINTNPIGDGRNVSTSRTNVGGSIYSNTDIVVTFNTTDYIHETDSSSIIKPHVAMNIGTKSPTNWAEETQYFYVNDNDDSATSILPATANIGISDLAAEENVLTFNFRQYAFLDTIDPTDRAGKYLSTFTITVSTL